MAHQGGKALENCVIAAGKLAFCRWKMRVLPLENVCVAAGKRACWRVLPWKTRVLPLEKSLP